MQSIYDNIALQKYLLELGEKPFRINQIYQALYKDLIEDISTCSTISAKLRDDLKENFSQHVLTVSHVTTSANGQTTKFLLDTYDGNHIECVIMRHLSGRNTLCISCQAGCPMACTFCATGKLGLLRNLTVGEIVEQVMIAIHHLKKEKLQLRNIVFMGMGEPFLNYPEVNKALEIFCAPKFLNFSERRVTISTCGIVPGIKKLMVDHPQVSLAISLHAPNDEARRSIMPVDNTYPLDVLMKTLDEYVETTNKRIFYEYIMIQWVTDKLSYAYELADLMQNRLGHVNFIPYNAGEGIMGNDMQPTPSLMIKKFQRVLEERGIPSTVRFTMGDDIDAACGQLALKVDGKKIADVQGKRIGW